MIDALESRGGAEVYLNSASHEPLPQPVEDRAARTFSDFNRGCRPPMHDCDREGTAGRRAALARLSLTVPDRAATLRRRWLPRHVGPAQIVPTA